MKPPPLVVVFVLALVLGHPAARAAEREIAASLTLDQAVAAALADNAALHAMRAKWEAMRERPVQATTLPNPMFHHL